MAKDKKRGQRKSNKQLLKDWLFQGYVQRTGADFGDGAVTMAQKLKAAETSHLQSMAQLFADELKMLGEGMCECLHHPGRIAGACPVCQGLWPEA